MLNVDTIKNGLVIDHIKASFTSALIMNVPSKKAERKDIIKIDNIINIDFSVLGFVDPNICVNIIKDEKIVRKIRMELPDRVENVIKCKNPRCITMTEHYVPQVFILADRKKATYRCEYCDAFYTAGKIE